MSWIHEADVQLPNVIKSMSINPKAMEAVQGLNRAITFGASSLTRIQEEAIATTGSVANRCSQTHTRPRGSARPALSKWRGIPPWPTFL